MTHDELQAVARRQPFKPFRIVLTTGAMYDIRHPDLIMVGKRSAAIGFTGVPGATSYDLLFQVDLLHVVGLEELPPVAASSSNGAGS